MLGGPPLHCQMEIFALIISPSLSFSQHTSAQKTVDELGFDQGTMSEFMKKIQYQLGLAASYHCQRVGR